jgi:hypothetical protein
VPSIQFVHVFALASLPITTISYHLAMDSIPQEIIDEIIDNVPQYSLPSCSLVAKRWRRPSQRHVLSAIAFLSEGQVNRWCTDIPRDSEGISSHVRRVAIKGIVRWTEPAIFGRMLGTLGSLTELSLEDTDIPDELPGHISHEEFGKGITALSLDLTNCTLATMTSMILSFPDLKELSVVCEDPPEEPFLTDSVTPQREPLDSLELLGSVGRIGEALARFRFISSRLSLRVRDTGVEQLLMLSSEVVVELELHGA